MSNAGLRLRAKCSLGGDRVEKQQWLTWAQEIQSIGQAGVEYSPDEFDRERFKRLRSLAAEIISQYADISIEKATDLFAGENGYQTPKVDVRAVVPQDDRILLVKENDNKWALPGGWAEPNLSLRENVAKEVMEEAGVTIEPQAVIAILDRNRHTDDNYPYSVYKIFVRCTYLGGQFEHNIETSDAKFFSRTEIPELSITRTTMNQLLLCFDRLLDNNIETLFE